MCQKSFGQTSSLVNSIRSFLGTFLLTNSTALHVSAFNKLELLIFQSDFDFVVASCSPCICVTKSGGGNSVCAGQNVDHLKGTNK